MMMQNQMRNGRNQSRLPKRTMQHARERRIEMTDATATPMRRDQRRPSPRTSSAIIRYSLYARSFAAMKYLSFGGG